jgi:hypothetical protein
LLPLAVHRLKSFSWFTVLWFCNSIFFCTHELYSQLMGIQIILGFIFIYFPSFLMLQGYSVNNRICMERKGELALFFCSFIPKWCLQFSSGCSIY